MNSLVKSIAVMVVAKSAVFLALIAIGAYAEHQDKKNDDRKWKEFLSTAKI